MKPRRATAAARRRPARRAVGARRRRRRGRRFLVALAVLALVGGALAVAVLVRGPFFFMSCDVDDLLAERRDRTTRVYASNGSLLATVGREQRHEPVALSAISSWLPKATIAAEDRRFYEHGGVDYRALLRALIVDVREGEAAQGGSTITQQLVRNLSAARERSLGRKLTEGCLAVELERRWSKDRILEAYLNEIYYGNRAYGIEAASQMYFSKRAKQLALEDAALLAALPRAPSQLDPLARRGDVVAAREQVLAAMRETGFVSDGRFERARRATLGLRPSPAVDGAHNASIANLVLDELVERYGAAAVRRGGFRVHTTIDARLQRLARSAIRRTLDRRRDPAAALVAVNPRNGAIRAMVSVVPGREAYTFNLAAHGRRQSGSAFKPFVLVEALRRGINPWATRYLSAPFVGPRAWKVETYDRTYAGKVTVADATLRSDNTVYARLTLDLGPRRVADLAETMGITSPMRPVPSLGLGTGTVSPLETAAAYATLANNGLRAEPLLIRKVVLPSGTADSSWGKVEEKRVLSDAVAFYATRVLEGNLEAGTGTRARIGRPAAGKTGTTDDHADAWFAGYTPELVAVVWMGYPTAAVPMRSVHGITVSGGTLPAAIWQRFMAPALATLPASDWRRPRETIEWRRWCGRFRFARSFEDAPPEAGCPKRPKRRRRARTQTTTPPAATVKTRTVPTTVPTTEDPPPPPRPTTTTETETEPLPPFELVGMRGRVTVVIDDEAESGEVAIDGKRWPARSERGDVIDADVEVEVVRVDARFLYVEPALPEGAEQ